MLNYGRKDSMLAATKTGSLCGKCGHTGKRGPRIPTTDSTFSKPCPICFYQMRYRSLEALRNGIRHNSTCKQCHASKSSPDDLKRNCSVCQSIITHKTKFLRNRARKLDYPCRSCGGRGKIPWNKGIPHTTETLEKISSSLKGRTFDSDWTEKISKAHRIRLSEKLRGANRCPRYNLVACRLFDEINASLGWNGQYGTNGKEYYIKSLGYWVDYYEPNLNIVIEYDETHHKSVFHTIKDTKRQADIVKELNCKFYRIREGQDWREVLQEYVEK